MTFRFIRPFAVLAATALLCVSPVSLANAGDNPDGHHGNHHGRHHHGGWWHKVSGLDQRWLMVHTETNLFEIAGGQAAQSKASSSAVRELGAELVRDHTVAQEQTNAVAECLHVGLPDAPSPLQDWALRVTQSLSGSEFDRWFVDLQVQGHKQAIVEASVEAALGKNPKVRGLARASLPVLERHLEHAQALLGQLSP